MNDIQKLMEEMSAVKQKDAERQKNVKYERNKKKKKLTEEEIKAMLPPVKSKEEVQEELKHQFRNAWRAPGFCNSEFSSVPVLQAKVLTEWEYERIYMSERSYKAPEGYKGFKVDHHGKEFGDTGVQNQPQKFVDYMKDFKDSFIDFQYRPSKYGKIHLDDQLERIKLTNKEPFRLVNTQQSRDFGFDSHSTFERVALQTLRSKRTNSAGRITQK